MKATQSKIQQVLAAAVGLGMVLSPVAEGDIVVQWTFNDDNANDSIGTAHGTLVGGPTFVSTPADAGMFNRGISMDGIDDLVNFAQPAAIVGLVDGITIEAWVAIDTTDQASPEANNYEIFARNGSWRLGYEHGGSASGSHRHNAQIHRSGGSGSGEATTPVTNSADPSGTFRHLLVTSRIGDPVQFYIDGICQSGCDGGGRNGNIIESGNDVLLNGGNFLEMIVDEVTIHNNRMNPSQVGDRVALGPVQFVPEPGTVALFGLGLIAIRGLPRRKNG